MRKKILIIEPDSKVANFLCNLAKEKGWEPSYVSGKHPGSLPLVVEALEAKQFSFAIVNYQLGISLEGVNVLELIARHELPFSLICESPEETDNLYYKKALWTVVVDDQRRLNPENLKLSLSIAFCLPQVTVG